jgi:tRNA-specific 2-thiouridylase
LSDDALWKKSIEIGSIHWINDAPAEGEYDIRVRHRASLTKAKLAFQGGTAALELTEPQRAVTAGQSVVIYDGDVCLGGGIVI